MLSGTTNQIFQAVDFISLIRKHKTEAIGDVRKKKNKEGVAELLEL